MARIRRSMATMGIIAGIVMPACDSSNSDDVGSEAGDESASAPNCVDQRETELFILECTPLYEPTWANVYEFEFKPHTTTQAQSGCGQPGLACHGQGIKDDEVVWGAGALGGFGITGDATQTHSLLLNSQPSFVDPLNPACSPLVVRMQIADSNYWMPPGSQPYDSRRRCSILRWLSQGALPHVTSHGLSPAKHSPSTTTSLLSP